MGTQGFLVSENTILNILQMLASTQLSIKEIAQQACSSQNLVVSVNRRFQIRVVSLLDRKALLPEARCKSE